MNKFSNKLVWALVLGTALVAGCGGGGGGDLAEVQKPTTPTNLSVSALFNYLSDLIAGTSETSEPVDVNGLTLAVDETTEPTPLN